MPSLFRNESSNPVINAQRNLMGRTHYVDPDTLKFHKSRVMSARHVCGGLLFAIVTSDALDYQNARRGFRYAIFDLFGTVIDRPTLENAFRTRQQAEKAMWRALEAIDADNATRNGIAHARSSFESEMLVLVSELDNIQAKQAA